MTARNGQSLAPGQIHGKAARASGASGTASIAIRPGTATRIRRLAR